MGGYPFTIDDDAYTYLDKYLKKLEYYFRGSSGYEEIMIDIESRMAELITESKGQRPIVSMTDIEAAVEIMGHPEEISEEGESVSESGSMNNSTTKSKRMYRDTENKVIGGVCSGLSAYFGFKDPIWMRLGFAFVFLTAGIGLLIYLVLWVILPPARTSAEKLTMRGEPVNINSIANQIREDVSDLSKRITDLGKELKSR